MLRKMRSKYPFRLVIDKQRSPKPPSIDKAVYGDFAYMPMTDGNEWLFLTREARALFIQTHGGTILGE